MSDETAERPAKRGILRRVLWALGIGLGLLFLMNLFFPRPRLFDGGPGWIDSY